jgi:hypothetical protein
MVDISLIEDLDSAIRPGVVTGIAAYLGIEPGVMMLQGLKAVSGR